MLSGRDALIFLPLVLAICLWVAWSDMKFMKIPNKAVLALGGLFVLIGPLLLPFYDWLWAIALMVIVLAIGFAMSTFRMVGAGDAKFAAAMAPYFVGGDAVFIMLLIAACLIGALVVHRLLRRIPRVRAATPDWMSWTRGDFPAGLALASAVLIYLLHLIRIDFLA